MQDSYRASCPSLETNHASVNGRHRTSTAIPAWSETEVDPTEARDRLKPSESMVVISTYMAASGTPFQDAINELLPEGLVDKALQSTRDLWSELAPEMFVDYIAKSMETSIRSWMMEGPNGCSFTWEERNNQAKIALLCSLRDKEQAIETQASRKRQSLEARIEDLKRQRRFSNGDDHHDRSSPTPTEIIDNENDDHSERYLPTTVV